MTMDKDTHHNAADEYENAVFVSYAYEGESERIAREIEDAFKNRDIEIFLDKKDGNNYRGSIQEFAQRLGRGQCIVLVISDKYLRSEHCMYELLEIERNHEFRQRIFPIVLADAPIFDPNALIPYISYWREKAKSLNQGIVNTGDISYMTNIYATLDKYKRIEANFDHLIGIISDMNALTPKIYENSGFATLISEIEQAGCGEHSKLLKSKETRIEPVLKQYLKWIFDNHIKLPLSKIIENAQDKFLNLGLVYVPLEADDSSALELLAKHSRLVLTGDSGSGKSTFVDFFTVCMAGEFLEADDNRIEIDNENYHHVNLEFLAGNSGRWWNHGCFIPMRVKLRNFEAFHEQGSNFAPGERLREFILFDIKTTLENEWESEPLQKLLSILKRYLQQESDLPLILFLDGWDEIGNNLRSNLKKSIELFAYNHSSYRIVVTSRSYAYQPTEPQKSLSKFEQVTLINFSREKIIDCIDKLYPQISEGDVDQQVMNFRRAVLGNEKLYELAERPLLLTLMVSLHAGGNPLPESREEVYAASINLMLYMWDKKRRKNGDERPGLRDLLHVKGDEVRNLLNELAFQAHSVQVMGGSQKDLAYIPDLVSKLLGLCPENEHPPKKTELNEILYGRAGIIAPAGSGFSCSHRAFQEYLAACYLTDPGPYPDRIVILVQKDFDRWYEVALLALARAKRLKSMTAWSLVYMLCDGKPPSIITNCDGSPSFTTNKEEQQGALLSGLALLEDRALSKKPINLTEKQQSKQKDVQDWLVYVMRKGDLSAYNRIRAGYALARLGDIRFDPVNWFLPCDCDDKQIFGFCYIESGEFIMGDGEGENENRLSLPEYWLGKYPVTVAQFGAYANEKMEELNLSSGSVTNCPVVNISWKEAILYCNWLQKKLLKYADERGLNNAFWYGLTSGSLIITLPSEAEWEKAARGTDRRKYPWGDFGPDKANLDNSTKDTSPVGAYPRGQSHYGLFDMSGNVRELTRSLWGTAEAKCSFSEKYLPEYEREQIGASDGNYRVLRGGSYQDIYEKASCIWRESVGINDKKTNVGFRVAISPGPVIGNEKWRKDLEVAIRVLSTQQHINSAVKR